MSGSFDVASVPEDSLRYRPPLGLIGCGGITVQHLEAYRAAGYEVVALCDVQTERAEARRRDFYPGARVYSDYRDLLRREDIEVVDIATHPAERVAIIESALMAGKHVLSQKPFVVDLDEGARLADLADQRGLWLSVNQNGRWAPHFCYMRSAQAAGLLGDIASLQMSVHWDHTWVRGTPFEQIHHLILYDFAIHWFDMVACLMGGHQAQRVFATVRRTATQTISPPLLAQVMIEFPAAQANLLFAAETYYGPLDLTFLVGSCGSLESRGPSYREQTVTLWHRHGQYSPHLRGSWFPDGFRGTMGELLRSIEARRPSSINARNNLDSLALCFAAVESAETGQPVRVGSVRRLSI